MKKKTGKRITYTKGDIGDVRVIEDFLPPPDQLLFKDEEVKVTLPLKRRSLEFFKRQAARRHKSYQHMIAALIDRYADHFGQ